MITTAEAKAFCRVEHSSDDALFASLISAATKRAEQITGCATTPATNTKLTKKIDRPIILFPHPVTAVTAIERGSGSAWVDASAWFDVDLSARPARLDLIESASLSRGESLRVTFTAGWSSVPADFRMAVLQIIAHWYENREAVVTGTIAIEVPMGAANTLQGYQGLRLL